MTTGKAEMQVINIHKLSNNSELLYLSADENEVDDLRCPFCGSTVLVKYDEKFGNWYDECVFCGVKTPPHFFTKSDAREFWKYCEEDDG